MRILDVGCGNDPKGNVNIDLFPKQTIHRKGNLIISKIPNFIQAECSHLPFKNDTFNLVFCCHLLEHDGVDIPKTCMELLRVAQDQVVIRVPSMLARYYKTAGHTTMFTRETFQKLFRNFNAKIKYRRTRWIHALMPNRYLQSLISNPKFKNKVTNPLQFLPCPIPTEIEVVIQKRKART
jgi:ubiquinone/menaquinone biosynthesis C-methylase UbiE